VTCHDAFDGSHFAPKPYSKASDVAAWARQARDQAHADRGADIHEHDRHGGGRLLQRLNCWGARGQNDVRRERQKLLGISVKASGIACAQRVSIRTLRPSVQPNCCSPCRNAAMRACPSASSGARFMSTPVRCIRSPSACAASGHVAAPPSKVTVGRNHWQAVADRQCDYQVAETARLRARRHPA
jgi:hypothetical protein